MTILKGLRLGFTLQTAKCGTAFYLFIANERKGFPFFGCHAMLFFVSTLGLSRNWKY
jgi:hypothetical protein